MHGSKVRQYDLKKLDLLKEIYDKTNCTIVMSSSWRTFYFDYKFQMDYGCMVLKKDLKERGIEINYCTGNKYHEKWYTIYHGYEWIKDKDGTYNIEYVEPENRKKPPKVRHFYGRGLQIKIFKDEWEKEHGKCNFAILDDDDGDLHLFGKHFVQTSWYGQNEEETALTPKHIDESIRVTIRFYSNENNKTTLYYDNFEEAFDFVDDFVNQKSFDRMLEGEFNNLKLY